jgi:hypothetical protein
MLLEGQSKKKVMRQVGKLIVESETRTDPAQRELKEREGVFDLAAETKAVEQMVQQLPMGMPGSMPQGMPAMPPGMGGMPPGMGGAMPDMAGMQQMMQQMMGGGAAPANASDANKKKNK